MATPTKAYLVTETKQRLPFLFNPESLTFSKSLSWDDAPVTGSGAPQQQFAGSGSVTFSLKLLFDTTATTKPVTNFTDKLFALTLPDPKLPGAKPDKNMVRPPWVQFFWGKIRSYKAIIEQYSVSFTYFAPDGTPLRAEVELSLKQYEDEGALPPQNPTSGTPEIGRRHVVRVGDYIDTVALEQYGDSAQWRMIASANPQIDVFALEPGTVLDIPPG